MSRSTAAIYALRCRSVRLISITTCSRRTTISLIGAVPAGAQIHELLRSAPSTSHLPATVSGRVEPGVHDLVRDRRQLEIEVRGVAAQCVENCVEAEAVALGKNALRQLDRDPAR
jgi:hypothetical protein